MESEHGYWDFIEKYLPDYYTNDLVLRSDILWRYVDNDDVDGSDKIWIEEEFATKTEIVEEIVRIETQLFENALRNYCFEYAKVGESRQDIEHQV